MKASQFKSSTVLAIALLCLFGATSAWADSIDPAWTASSTVYTYSVGYGENLGAGFVATQSGTINALGIYNLGSFSSTPGVANVGLYNSDGRLLTSTTVSDTDTTLDGYYWASTTPVSVIAGDTYTVIVYYPTGTIQGVGGSLVNNWGLYTTQSDSYPSVVSGLAYTTETVTWVGAYYGGNVSLETTPPPPPLSGIPEPSSLLLFGSGLLGMAGVLRRKLSRS